MPADGEAELEVDADVLAPLLVLNFENCCVCFLLPHLGQAMGEFLVITSFSYGDRQSLQTYS